MTMTTDNALNEMNKEVSAYDLRCPPRFSKNHMELIREVNDLYFADFLKCLLARYTRTIPDVKLESVSQITYEDFMKSVYNPSTISIIDMPSLNGYGVMEITPSLTTSIIEKICGGIIYSRLNINRELTEIESVIMEAVIKDIIKDLGYEWSNNIDSNFELRRLEVYPKFVKIANHKDEMIVITIKIEFENNEEDEGYIKICFPYKTIKPAIQRLCFQSEKAKKISKPSANFIENLKLSPLNTHLSVKTKDVNLKRVISFKKGDLIEIDMEKISFDNEQGKIFDLAFDHDSFRSRFRFNVKKDLQILKTTDASLDTALNDDKEIIKINNDTTDEFRPDLQVRPFNSIRKYESTHLLRILAGEHPQIIAMVLAYLEPDQSRLFLESLPNEIKSDIAKRIATMVRPFPEILSEVERVLEKKLSSLASEERTSTDGLNTIVEILNRAFRSTERTIIEAIEAEDPGLAEDIKIRMFVFEDIVLLGDRDVQKLLREVDTTEVAKALKGVNSEVQDKVFRNMSKRAASLLKEDMDFMGPVKLKDVEEAQYKIVSIIRRLEESGDITIAKAGGDILVV